LDRVPRLRIQALLWAGMAHLAAKGGGLTPPGRGAMTDVNVISTVLPYCDALLIDNQMRSLLEFGPVRDRLGFDTRVFSPKTFDDLIDYLDLTESEAPEGVAELATKVYGDPKPYLTIFHDPQYRLGAFEP